MPGFFSSNALTRALHRRHRERALAAAASWPIAEAKLLRPEIVAKDELAEGTVAQDSQIEIPFYFELAADGTKPNQPCGFFGGHLRTVALSHSEASRLLPRITEGTLVRVRYNPQNPDENHTLATDNDDILSVAVWPN